MKTLALAFVALVAATGASFADAPDRGNANNTFARDIVLSQQITEGRNAASAGRTIELDLGTHLVSDVNDIALSRQGVSGTGFRAYNPGTADAGR